MTESFEHPIGEPAPEVHTVTSKPRREWNPLAKLEPERRALAVSDMGDGPTAWVDYRRWSGRERLAYEDALTERSMTQDQRGEDTVRLGTLRLIAVSLTIVGWEAYGVDEDGTRRPITRPDGSPMFSGDRTAVEQDLLALDPDTYDEIRRTALEIQPPPSLGGEDVSASADDDASAKALPGGESDPSPTP